MFPRIGGFFRTTLPFSRYRQTISPLISGILRTFAIFRLPRYRVGLVYKCLLMAAPVYLAEMFVPAAASTGRQCLYVQHHMVT